MAAILAAKTINLRNFDAIQAILTVFFFVDIYKIASDYYQEEPNEEKIVLYGKEEQCHNPCGFVNDIYIYIYLGPGKAPAPL